MVSNKPGRAQVNDLKRWNCTPGFFLITQVQLCITEATDYWFVNLTILAGRRLSTNRRFVFSKINSVRYREIYAIHIHRR